MTIREEATGADKSRPHRVDVERRSEKIVDDKGRAEEIRESPRMAETLRHDMIR